MSGGPVLVVAALAAEMRPLARRLRGRRERRGGASWLSGRLGARDAALALTGVGPRAAGRGAAALVAELRPGALIGIGVAGGLSPELEEGSLVAAREVLDAEGHAAAADPEWLGRALAGSGIVDGRLVTVERVVDSVAAKRELWRRLGGGERLAVDLEAAAWATAASARGLPWLVVKVISDPAGEELPLPFGRLAGAGGGVSRARVMAHLALHPGRLPATLALGRRVAALAERLAPRIEELVA